jgi:hypothetical protein
VENESKGKTMGIFGKKKTTPAAQAGPVTITGPITYDQAMAHIGASGSVRDDDITWDMTMPKTQLSKNGYHAGMIRRKGNKVEVIVGGRVVGSLTAESAKTANLALLQHGGQAAKCMITSGTSKGDIVRVAKLNGGVVNL